MLPYLLAAGSTLLSAQAGAKAGENVMEAGVGDYEDAALAGHFKEKGLREKWSRSSGTMRARTAASGVEMAGSPLEVLMHSAGQAERDLVIARHMTKRNLEAADARIERGAAGKQMAITSGLWKLGALGMDAYGDMAGGYKPPGKKGFDLTDEEMRQYGWD